MGMDSAQITTLLIAAAGAGGILSVIVNAFFKWASGASGREKIRNTGLLSQLSRALIERDKANARADDEATKRRRIAEYASMLRGIIFERGGTPPDWPEIEQTVPRNTD